MDTAEIGAAGGHLRKELLESYYVLSQNRRGAAAATALRTRSVAMRDVLVRGATTLTDSSETLKRAVLSGRPIGPYVQNPRVLADLGRVVLLQDLLEDDLEFGEKLLKTVLSISAGKALPKSHAMVLFQHLIASDRHYEAQELFDKHSDRLGDEKAYILAELRNPYVFESHGDMEFWLREFNRPLTEAGFTPITVKPGSGLPFNRVVSTPAEATRALEAQDQPLISVIMTAYKPEEFSLLTSVDSILRQSWQNFELIIIDDCSGEAYRPLFEHIETLDSRIRVIRADQNHGTYASRDLGYAWSAGDFITGQDDDDWSHPERLTYQMEYLNSHPESIGCKVSAIQCDDQLSRTRIGYSPLGQNASSLMIRREGYEAIGGYVEARKAADTEYQLRLTAATGRPVGVLQAPLSLVRISPDSLSRNHFSAGWKHASRRAFRSGYEHWHKHSAPHDLRIRNGDRPPIVVPSPLVAQQGPTANGLLDVVIAGDWMGDDDVQRAMLDKVFALLSEQYRVGILHLESPNRMHKKLQYPLNPDIQGLINYGQVEEVFYDDDVRIRLLLVCDASVLQFITSSPASLAVSSMYVMPIDLPADSSNRNVRYLVDECHSNAAQAFRIEPSWIPQSEEMRSCLMQYLPVSALTEFCISGVIDVDDWWSWPLWYRSATPVIGRASPDCTRHWPEDRKIIEEVYPTDGSKDVRMMGGASAPLSVLGKEKLPAGWTAYEPKEMSRKKFHRSLDYFVLFQRIDEPGSLDRTVLEALASGTVVVLPGQYKDIYGEAAIYAETNQVMAVVDLLHADFDSYTRQLEVTKEVLDRSFSREVFRNKIASIFA